MVTRAVKNLARYGVEKGLIQSCDEVFVMNRILQELGMNSLEQPAASEDSAMELEEILKILLDYACEKGIIENILQDKLQEDFYE